MLQQKKQLVLHKKNKMHLFIPLFILFSTLTYFNLKKMNMTTYMSTSSGAIFEIRLHVYTYSNLKNAY